MPQPQPIPNSVIASVKANTPFLALLRGYGLAPERKGKSYFVTCPFHDVDGHPENSASLSVDPDKNLYHCFSCDAKGNVIQFVQAMDKVDFRGAVRKLLAVKPPAEQPEPQPALRLGSGQAAKEKQTPAPVAALGDEERQTILAEVMTATTECLRNSKSGRQYLEKRGLDPLTLLESYAVGYWDSALYGKLAAGERKKLVAVGLLSDSGRALFEGCVVLPLQREGRIVGMYGRKASAEPSANGGSGRPFGGAQGRHYMLPGKREGLYLPRTGLNPQRPVIITESIIDALSSFTAGVRNVLPLLGVNGFLPDHLAYLKEQRFPMVYIALNGDEAGNKAAAQLKQNLTTEGIAAQVLQLPEGKDLNQMLVELGPGKLTEWLTQRTTQSHSGPRPTVWEDEAGDTFVTIEEREYRIRGLTTVGLERLKVNVKACRVSARDSFYVDTLDLYHGRSRETLVGQVARVLESEPAAIGRDMNMLITVLESLRLRKKDTEDSGHKRYEMSEEEKREALEYLRSPDLIERIAADFAACGMVGNRNQCLLAYLGALSRLTEQPFGTLIVSRSGAGKSYLQDMIAAFTPEESLLRMTRLTGQSLFYQGKEGLKHKLLSIEEDEGMQEAMYSIRVLLSSQRLCLHGLKSDPKTGEFHAYENTVVGPAAVMISTTNLAAFCFENVNRFFVVFLDESREQTAAILEHHSRMVGIEKMRLKQTRKRVERLHRNVQRLLKPVTVVNRLGSGIVYPADILNTRRECTKTESLIETVALLHQYQRTVQSQRVLGEQCQYIEVTAEDIQAVHAIAGDILRQSLDEMPKLCRDLLGFIHALVAEKYKAAAKEEHRPERWQVTFTRKELQEASRWSRWHLEEHLKELEESGYIVQRMGKRGQRYAYSLVEERMPPQPDIGRVI